MQSLNYATAVNDRHSTMVKTWAEQGMWWAQMTVDGRVLSYEAFGPVDETEPA